jgi:DNA-binding FrmR family transcriptional regulator
MSPATKPPGATATRTSTRGYTATKDQLRNRLRRVEGQIRGIEGMVDEDRWCPDILQQIAAAQAALDKIALGLAEGHVKHCMAQGADSEQLEEMTAELMHALGRLVR